MYSLQIRVFITYKKGAYYARYKKNSKRLKHI